MLCVFLGSPWVWGISEQSVRWGMVETPSLSGVVHGAWFERHQAAVWKTDSPASTVDGKERKTKWPENT